MNGEQLDEQIRAMVASAVATAQPAPALPTLAEARVTTAPRSARTGWYMAGAGIAAAAALVGVLVWANDDDEHRVVPATTVPIPTSEVSVTTVAPITSWWPDDLEVLVSRVATADSGAAIERVSAENSMAVVTRLEATLDGDRAFELPDGTIVADAGLVDVGLLGDRLIRTRGDAGAVDGDGTVVIAVDAADNSTVIDGNPARLTHGLDIYVGQTGDETTWAPFLMTIGGGQVDTAYWTELGVAGPHSGANAPRLFSVSPSGSTIGWVQGDQFVVANGGSFKIPDGSNVTSDIIDVDLTDEYVALTRVEGVGQLIDLRTGDAFPSPAAGRLTISLRTPESTPPTSTTPTTQPVPSVGEVSSAVITAGPDGVWRVVDGVAEQLTTDAMSMALQLPDGSLIMQRKSGWAPAVAPAETALLGWADGASYELFPGEAMDGWTRLYDIALVQGELTVLYAVEPEQANIESPTPELVARSLETGVVTVVATDFGGWEAGHSRMYLAETGLIVGESYAEASRMLVSYAIGGATPIDAATLGLESVYSDCNDCPRLYTVSRDGSTVAWLDGTQLIRHRLVGPTGFPPIELGDVALTTTQMELGSGYVVLNSGWGDPVAAAAPRLIEFGGGTIEGSDTPGIVATAVVAPTAPWQTDDALTAALERQDFATSEELYSAVEQQILDLKYAAVEPVEPITFTRGQAPDGSLTISAPNFDDSVPETWYRIVLGEAGVDHRLVIERIEFADVCRNFTFSTPTHLCV